MKYENVYLKDYDDVSAAWQNLGAYLEFHNARQPHQSDGGRAPDMVYFDTLSALKEAA